MRAWRLSPFMGVLLSASLGSLWLSGCANQGAMSPAASPSQSATGTTTIPATSPVTSPSTSQEWAALGRQQALRARPEQRGPARNLILVVGDGMGITTLTAARIFAGQQQGLAGEEFRLSFEQLPYSALVKTYNTDRQTPDSAGTMTALVTGHKTDAGVLSVGAGVERGNCSSLNDLATQSDQALPTLFDLARRLNKRTAIVTTTRITHATPAALYAHSVERNWESDDAMTAAARRQGCHDIASQLLQAHQHGQGPDIIVGGGRRHFVPEAQGGRRQDGQDLIAQWQALPNAGVLQTQAQLQHANLARGRWLGLFADSHLPYIDQRPASVPSLQDMVQQVYAGVKDQPDGYVLVIEAGRIDHAHHDGNAQRALRETYELHQTMEWLLAQINFDDTLVMVTADHSHTLTLQGYPTRGNPILGLVHSNDEHGEAMAEPWLLDDGKPYTSLSYRNGPGAVDSQQRPKLQPSQVADIDFRQPALVPLESETHGGEDVAVYGAGPWAHLLGGTLEQHWLYHVMQHALTANPE